VSQTPENQTNSDDEVVRKVFARDLKPGQTVSTVFRVGDKERHTAKSGKVFLSMTLFDKTGRIDGRIFENVDAAEATFQNDDYLLVSGKVAVFHGKAQIVVERLEKLDPGPMDPKEFTPPPEREREKPTEGAPSAKGGKGTRQRLLNLLDDPAIASGVDALMRHLERYIDERVEQRLFGRGPKPERPERPDRPERPERHEKKPEPPKEPHKSGLPKDLAFKPFTALAGEPAAPAPAAAEGTADKPS
jgi:hypothetical protein